MRRSNSNQRGSLLPDKAIAPPVCQNLFQYARASDSIPVKGAGGTFISANPLLNDMVNASSVVSLPEAIRNSCLVWEVMFAPCDQRAKMVCSSLSNRR